MQVERSVRKYREWRTGEEHVGIDPGVRNTTGKPVTIPHRLGAIRAKLARAPQDEPAPD